MARKKKIIIKKHVLIPKHVKLNEKEKKELFEQYNISVEDLPRITIDDPALATMKVKIGDVIKISRASETAGEAMFYRGVVSE